MTKELSIGVVGAGDIVRRVHLPVLKNVEQTRLAWIADANADLAAEAGELFDVPHVPVTEHSIEFPACDVALLAVPVHARKTYLEYFAKRKTAVFAEKPFATTVAEHRDYLEMFADVPIACAYMRRTHANVRALRRMVVSGWFGDLRSIRYREGNRQTSTQFASRTLDLSYRLGGGVLRDLGCHGIDTIGFITGAVSFSSPVCNIEWDEQTDRDVKARFVAEGVGGHSDKTCDVEFTVSWLSRQANTIELHFERAHLRCGIKPDAPISIASDSDFADELQLTLAEPGAISPYQSYFLEWDAVLSSVRSRDESEFDASRGLWTTAVVDALYATGGAP